MYKSIAKTSWQRRGLGFTLVELVIVIAIIAILSAIAVASYHGVQVNADDSDREADVTAIMDSLEDYYAKNGEYPANDDLNPDGNYPQMNGFTKVRAILPDLTDEMLTGPGGYQFYPGCVNSASCPNTSDDWRDYMTKAYMYSSRYRSNQAGSYAYFNVPSTYGDGTGWGCSIYTYYDDPGYMIAWYSQSKKLWIFKRSKHGEVNISSYGSGPVAPQTCTFS